MRRNEALDRIFREEHGLVLASLVRFFRDFDLAEESLQDAVTTALRSWTVDGIPDHPAGWLVTVARRKGIDQLRRRKNLARLTSLFTERGFLDAGEPDEEHTVPDERLRLMFTCCHPALPMQAQVALTLRTLGGLTTAEIARAFLASETTMYQRITRAKRKIALAGIPYSVPSAPGAALSDRVATSSPARSRRQLGAARRPRPIAVGLTDDQPGQGLAAESSGEFAGTGRRISVASADRGHPR